MDGEFGLDFESHGQRREALDVAPGEHPVAGEHVGQAIAEGPGNETGEQPVAEPVSGAVGRADLGDPRAVDHVEPVVDQPPDHGRGRGGVVGGVAVHQQVDLGLDVGEHATHDVALALQYFGADHRPGGPRHLGGSVGGIVVVDVDGCLGQHPAEIGDHGTDGHLLVVAGDKDGNGRWSGHGKVAR